jgi:hypothetical protein
MIALGCTLCGIWVGMLIGYLATKHMFEKEK